VLERLADERLGGGAVIAPQRVPGELERDHRVHEPLLRPVVHVAHDAAAFLVRRREDARADLGRLQALLLRDAQPRGHPGDEAGQAGRDHEGDQRDEVPAPGDRQARDRRDVEVVVGQRARQRGRSPGPRPHTAETSSTGGM
jgi:hypothetical protein